MFRAIIFVFTDVEGEVGQMNRIKVIKRASLQSPPERGETETQNGNQSVIKPQAVMKVVENWIDEWRASKPKDSRYAFAALFDIPPSATG